MSLIIISRLNSNSMYAFMALVKNSNTFPIIERIYKLLGSIEDKYSNWTDIGVGNVLTNGTENDEVDC